MRAGGILLHPTSLPSAFGIGDLGPSAYSFVDFLRASSQKLWQVLPLNPTGEGNSPYSSYSAFAANTLLISPEQLVADELLEAEDLAAPPVFPLDRVDFGAVRNFKGRLLRRSYDLFKSNGAPEVRDAFEEFCRSHEAWLNDFALFQALKQKNGGTAWIDWELEFAERQPTALAEIGNELREEIEAEKFYQFLFFRQWSRLKEYCKAQNVRVVGDLPIFVAHDSVDVWAGRQMFKLDDKGGSRVVAGVPPDYFSETGQFWGNPLYDWERLSAENFRWWVRRVGLLLKMFDLVRLDHFRGFAACWEIPANETTAANGAWVSVPGSELFSTLEQELGELPIIAEDLGVITPDVEALRDQFGFPGMRVLQFAFSTDENNIYLPHNYVPNCVAYTATHDNNTTFGWFTSAPERERKFCLQYLKSDGREINWDFIEAVSASTADTVIIPMQDVFGLGSEARMNVPSSATGNWEWRMLPDALTDALAERLKKTAERCER